MPSADLVAPNCHVSAATPDGQTVVWWSRNLDGFFDCFVGPYTALRPGAAPVEPMLPPWTGHRGPTDISPDGRYVLYTEAQAPYAWLRNFSGAEPGKGSQHAIMLYDCELDKATRLVAWSQEQRGIIWPKFSPTMDRITWTSMAKTASQTPPWGEWDLRVADLVLGEAPRVDAERSWRYSEGPGIYETYGWIPGTDRLIFQSSIRRPEDDQYASKLPRCQIWSIRDDLDQNTLQRMSPPYVSRIARCGQTPKDVFHEFAYFPSDRPGKLWTNVGAETVGGNDLFEYDLASADETGLLASAPKRITFFGGARNTWCLPYRVDGYPPVGYYAVTTPVETPDGLLLSVCPDIYCTKTNTWLIVPAE